MERIFFYILTMSLTASLLTIAVLALRLLLKRTPKALFCILWGFVAIRLIFPFSPESPFSLIPASLTATNPSLSERISFTDEQNVTENKTYETPQTGENASDAIPFFPLETDLSTTGPASSEEDLTLPEGSIVAPLPVPDTAFTESDTVF